MQQRHKEQYKAENACNGWKFVHKSAVGVGVTGQKEIERAEKLMDQALVLSAKGLGRKRK